MKCPVCSYTESKVIDSRPAEDVQKLKTQAREDHFGVKGKKREEIKPMKKKKGLFGLGKKKDEDDDFLIDANDDDEDDDDLFE